MNFDLNNNTTIECTINMHLEKIILNNLTTNEIKSSMKRSQREYEIIFVRIHIVKK